MCQLFDFIMNNDFYIIDMDDWEESEPMTFFQAIKERLEKMEDEELSDRWEICWTEKGESFEPNEIDSHELWRESKYSEWIQNLYFGEEEEDEDIFQELMGKFYENARNAIQEGTA